MSSASKWKVAAGVGCVAVLAFAACGRDIGGSTDGVAGPGGGIVDGARVTGRLNGTLEVAGDDRTPVLRTLPAVTFDTRVRGGIARADSVGTVAGRRVLGELRRSVRFADGEGHENEVVLSAASASDPVSELRHYRDGQLVVVASYGWERRAGGWVLRDRDFQLWRGEQLVLQRHQFSGSLEVARALDARRVVPMAAASVLRALAPAPLAAQNLRDCLGEWAAFAGAAFVLAAASDALAHQPWDPKLWAAVGVALVAVDAALDRVVYCETVNVAE